MRVSASRSPVYHNTTRPFIASHSSARAVCNHARNLTDDMIRAISERGGVAGINYCAGFLTDKPAADGHYYGTAALIADHIDHMRNVGGIDVVALGSDYDGISRRLGSDGQAKAMVGGTKTIP